MPPPRRPLFFGAELPLLLVEVSSGVWLFEQIQPPFERSAQLPSGQSGGDCWALAIFAGKKADPIKSIIGSERSMQASRFIVILICRSPKSIDNGGPSLQENVMIGHGSVGDD
jgi:hypothetical protein